MSSMAAEIQARMREDGIDPSETIIPGATDGPVPPVEVPPTATPERPGGTSAPGSDGGHSATAPPPQPSAGTQNAESGQGDPGPIPYARFKEVNDRYAELRGYEELAQYGYDADHLTRLAQFEAGYLRDPIATTAALVEDLDLPPEAKARVLETLKGESGAGDLGPGAATSVEDGSSSLSPEDRELLEWARKERETTLAERESAQRNAQLDTVMNLWRAADNEAKVNTPKDRAMLTYISTAASTGNHRTYQDLANAARQLWLEDRDEMLSGAVQNGRREGMPPPALPGSGALPAPAQAPKTLKDANKLARAAIERGELPGLGG